MPRFIPRDPAAVQTVYPQRARRRQADAHRSTGANLGFEATLWQAADKLRSNMDAAEYKHVVLGLVFLK